MNHNFKNLKIWQKAMGFTDLTFDYCKELPSNERFNLMNQLNRSSCSIPSNIAEGSGKRTSVHFAEYLTTSLTSAFEAETQLLICERPNYGQKEKRNACLLAVLEVQKMLFSFREHILNNNVK